MEIKLDDKEFATELAKLAVERFRDYTEKNGGKYMLYHEEVNKVVHKEVTNIIKRNEDKILTAVVDKLAEKYASQIKLACVLSALSNKEV